MNLSVRVAVLFLVPGLAVAAPPASVPTEPGVEWENTVEMQMAGFSMPAQTTKSCIPKKGMTEPPGSGKDDKCKVTRMKNDGKTMSWSIACEGKDKMTGEGEITQSSDGYDGKMTMRTADGEMLMKMRGKKLGTPCDAAAIKRQVANIQAEGAAGMAKVCAESAQGLHVSVFSGPQAICKDPADRKVLCERAATREGVRSLGAQPETIRKDLGTLCGKDFAAMRTQACAAAGKEEASTKCVGNEKPVLDFIGESCPAETQVVAQRECAGRTYTALQGSCFRSFCTSYAANLLDKGKKPAAPPQATPEDAAQDAAKKAVKSLLPF
jgi:Protein of unknown function (DUF3617)